MVTGARPVNALLGPRDREVFSNRSARGIWMPISTELSNRIVARIKEYKDTAPEPFNHQKIVEELQVLPLACDWAGCHAIRSNGEIIVFLTDHPGEWRVENDLRIRNMALFQGSLRYLELKELVPTRSANDQICPECSGTGIHPVNEKLEQKNVLCWCGGLGWTPVENGRDRIE